MHFPSPGTWQLLVGWIIHVAPQPPRPHHTTAAEAAALQGAGEQPTISLEMGIGGMRGGICKMLWHWWQGNRGIQEELACVYVIGKGQKNKEWWRGQEESQAMNAKY